jgi:hypothetical protein
MRKRSPGHFLSQLVCVLAIFLAVFALLLLQGCSGCSTTKKVTGQKGDPTTSGTQSETSAAIAEDGKTTRMVVAFNDETNDGTSVTYTASNRHMNSGASLMGWSYSDDDGNSWTYGGNVKPPKGWAAIWGDPAIGVSKKHSNVVFLSNLAIPDAKMPAGGIDGAVNPGYPVAAYLGGACIAKSTDAGKTFKHYQCVSNTGAVVDIADAIQGHFYDGGSIVASSTGEVFAAFVDVYTSQIDVYRSPDDDGTFKLMDPPFAAYLVGSHPRLRVGPDGSLYVAAQVSANDGTGNSYVYINRYSGGAWGTAVRASRPTIYYYAVDLNTTVDGSELTIRVANSLSFDIGKSSPDGHDAIRLLYVQYDSSLEQYYISATACSADLSWCGHVPQWELKWNGPGNSPVSVFNPEVAAWPGTKSVPAAWQATFGYHYGKKNTVNVARATLGYFSNTNNPLAVLPIDILQDTPVCSDQRGYWGDYDAMLRVKSSGRYSIWMRFLTNSSQGCPTRWLYLGENEHVQQVNYEF